MKYRPNREELLSLLEQYKTLTGIGKYLGVHRHVVADMLVCRGIPVPTKSESQQRIRTHFYEKYSKEEFEKMLDESKSVADLSRKLGVSVTPINEALQHYGIRHPTTIESLRKTKNISVPIPKEAMSIIDGLLLSDASLVPSSEITASFSLGTPSIEYASIVAKSLSSFGVAAEVHETKRGDKIVTTQTTLEFGELRKEWYPNGIKIVPPSLFDIDRNLPELWRWEYVGDGDIYHHKNSVMSQVRFSTCAFTVGDVNSLCKMLSRFEIKSSIVFNLNYPIIVVSSRHTEKFLDLIGDSPHPFFDYKWKVTNQFEKPCNVCGVIFYPRNRREVACSKKCYKVYVNAHARARYNSVPAEIVQTIPRTCPTCKIQFVPRQVNSSFCSKECYPKTYKKFKHES